MLYLNLNLPKAGLFFSLHLTLTNVVFESMWKCIIPFFVMPDLTLTNVVFEWHLSDKFEKVSDNLTLTNVVFELV